MYKILEKTQFSEKVFKFRIEAPAIAKHAHAGQFLMVRANETGERVPFTLAGWNGDEGWVESCRGSSRGLGRVHLHGDRQDHRDAFHL